MKNIIFLSTLFLLACQNTTQTQAENEPNIQAEEIPKEITILLSKDNDKAFFTWLNNIESEINYIDVYGLNDSELKKQLQFADGILIAGGNDVNASLYGKGSEIERCGKFDLARDTLELNMIDFALKNNVPLLCVCRGEQIFNVSQGGSLIIDIPTDFGTTVDHSGKITKNHTVHVKKGTLLYEISKVDSAIVNSLHHQAVDKLATNLLIGAKASDSLVESIELKDKSNHPFVLGVQWHPELIDTAGPMSNPIGRRFIEEVYIFNENKAN